jgi:hypothetical protein
MYESYKLFKKGSSDIAKNDVQMFLDRYRKEEAADPLHKWMVPII